jgi:hypothetical protein
VTRPPIPRWVAWPAAAAAALAAAPAALGAPAISGADGEMWSAAAVPVTYTITPAESAARVRWRLRAGEQQVASGTGTTVSLPGLADGSYQLFADENGDGSPITSLSVRVFSVDTVAPTVTIRAPVEGASYRLGQALVADYSCEGAVGWTPAFGQPLDTAVAGAHSFEVKAWDEAGNVTLVRRGYQVLALSSTPAPASGASASVAAAGAPAGPLTTPQAPADVGPPETANARLLRPDRGAVLGSTRPVLRWPARTGARLYNVQVFRLAGASYVKVLSAFPRTNRLRVPAGRLRRGARHVWRVWPMVGRSFTPEPIGVSYFEVRAKAR